MIVSRTSNYCNVSLDGAPLANVSVLNVKWFAGGANSDSCQFIIRPPHTPTSGALHDVELRNFFTDRLCEVFLGDAMGMATRIFYGHTAAGSFELDKRNESIVFTARFEPYHYSNVLASVLTAFRTPDVPSNAALSHWSAYYDFTDPVFNPVIDGLVTPNKGRVLGQLVLVPPESVHPLILEGCRRFGDGIHLVEESWVGLWTLADIVEYLLKRVLDVGAILPPDITAMRALLGEDTSLVRDLKIELGGHLPEILERVLQPYGFNWRIRYDVVPLPSMEIFKRGSASEATQVMLQFPGEQVDFDLTDVAAVNVDFDLSHEASNHVLILGDYEYREGTFELYRAWPEALDVFTGAVSFTDFLEGSAAWDGDLETRRVWRDWVLNEAGDYTGTRSDITESYSLTEFFELGPTTPRRRKFLPSLTRTEMGDSAGPSEGILIEWSRDDGLTWHDVRAEMHGVQHGSTFMRLDGECGVRFSSPDTFPWEMYHAGANCRVRVTATLKSEQRVFASVSPEGSLLTVKKSVVVDTKDRYKYRRVHRTLDGPVVNVQHAGQSSWYSQLADKAHVMVSETDDRIRCRNLAESLLAAWHRASCRGRITRFGVYVVNDILGRTVTRIFGREIGLKLSHEKATEHFPTVQAIELDFQKQTTSYFLDTPSSRQ